MKKLALIFTLLLFCYISFSQDSKREMSNYEKYRLQQEQNIAPDTTQINQVADKKEWDDLYYTPKTDAKKVKKVRKPYVDPVQAFVDTLKQDNPNIEVNVYELDPFYYSDRIGRFYYGGFNRWLYSYPWYYNSWMYEDYGWGWNPYYGYYDYPYYNDFYFGYTTFGNYWRPFPDWGFGFGFGWWYSNWSPWRHHNEWNRWNYYGNHNGEGFGNYVRGNYNQKNPIHYQTQNSTNINRRTVSPQTRANYSQSRRTYTPSYNNPRMNTRPAYNNSRIPTGNLFNRRANVNTQSNTQRIAPNTQRSTQSRNYSVPSRSYNSSRSNYSSGNVSRSSNYSSGSYSSGSSRSSGSYSGGSSSGGGRSSSGSSGRR